MQKVSIILLTVRILCAQTVFFPVFIISRTVVAGLETIALQ